MKRRRLFEIIGATLIMSLTALAGISCTQTSAEKLEGATWVLKAYGEPNSLIDALPDSVVTLNFNKDDKRVWGTGGVNTYGGNYQVDGNRLTVSELVSTEIAGWPPLQNQENTFFNILISAQSFDIDDNKLTITGTAGILVFDKK